MSETQGERLSRLVASATAVAGEVRADFGELTVEQLNWQPGPDRWSVGQCLDHLLTANESYFPLFERVLSGESKTPFWGRLPWLPALWGKLLLKTVSPETTRKAKAPGVFQPASSGVDPGIVGRFLDQQERTIRTLRDCRDLDLERIVIPSPVTSVITYSLMDAFEIIVAHEERHLQQARRVAEMDGFPG